MTQIVFGKNVVRQLLNDNKNIHNLWILEGFKDKEILSLIYNRKISFKNCGRKKLDELANGGNHQGIVAEIDAYKYADIHQLVDSIDKEYPLLVLLDGLEDPHNLGAILRTCDAVGADGVIIGKHRSVSLNPTVAKVSTGAIDYVPVCQVTNLANTLRDLKKKGYWVIGSDMYQAQDYSTPDYKMPIVLVIGSEGYGMSDVVKKQCDMFVSLPMVGHVTSLNASVACAVLLYGIYTNRNK
ncbi:MULTISPECIES: 23S rRNA (guanosine(2251)-2'-O)-methyltransferase RlmB [Breznakia]|uniref:23S rRNA (Guanosine2251-2'-O)-methyltransferase n=1 Tax=Breznakia blatticola TaxID=1754012 RepID=A0A4R7ZI04_9FIRM|nr:MULTISPECIES: 23S rRNA (guanosine(2251)-2'-O)-methyltransferase RlmB [Breznakia]MDH6366486.1 23S rRNA (guanosine2251-2'-O)-methyltransferase [Breznakia sp. PH1-1]MDH6403579.1 23S rRNA (guanosine2251-2'-O)-methyltransferase [Breznakia sp. PF1-11]MDH6411288.1 23S rRNA (guanosine2251-2'-O)-methyltransferase [Breznakia sp. PFB1-11]MDH6413736.1 23S rRNA (guanosine2251-2'-O)-methyltransferase [Breznakia sp. PFB1-14]MDH6415833.1 23S rRNA (guanosine2251-2'-O)-methyltransferase [Breznakia sp. PFB1-4